MTDAFWQESVVAMHEPERDIVVDPSDQVWRRALLRTSDLYADGGVLRGERCEAGSWAWVAADRDGRRMASQRGWMTATGALSDGVTNNISEFAAMLKALEAVVKHQPGWSGRMSSDSDITIGRFSRNWRLSGIPHTWQRRMRQALENLGNLEFVLLKGHPTAVELQQGFGTNDRSGRRYPVSEHQVLCDRLCRQTIREWSTAHGGKH
jgi:ribonuclease HI